MKENTDSLGEFQKMFTFKPAAERSFLAGIGLFLMALCGLYYGIIEAKFADLFLIVPSSLLLIGSLCIFRHGFSCKSITIRLFEKGFQVGIRENEFQFSWHEIAGVAETVVKRWGSGYWHILVTRNDGESFGFFEYDVDDAAELRETIEQNLAERGVSWETKSVR
jgi:hypothetical protein